MRKKQYLFADIRNSTAGRRTRSSQKESDNNGTSSSYSDDETTPKYIKTFWGKYQCQLQYIYGQYI